MNHKKLIIGAGLLAVLCTGCTMEETMPSSTPQRPTPKVEERDNGLAHGVEDVLNGVERTARDVGRRAEEAAAK